MDPKELKELWEKQDREVKTLVEKANEEVKNLGKMQAETKEAIEKAAEQAHETLKRVAALEQKFTAPSGGDNKQEKSIGQQFVESVEFKNMVDHGQRGSGQVKVGSFYKEQKTTIVNATGLNQPLVPAHFVPGIIQAPNQRLTIRDLLPVFPTNSNTIEFVKETGYTNAAGYQVNEGDAKPESALTFALSSVSVKTIAHWIPASKQILSDAPQLQAYIDSRLRTGLKLYEESQLLNGTGSGGQISGLIANATAYDTARTTIASDNYMDVISHALTQVRASFYEPDGIVLNDADWERIRLSKDTTGNYLAGGPWGTTGNTLWGKPVVYTPSMGASQFMVGAFGQAAAIYDREDATVEVSREHSDFFTRNLVAILAEERLALAVFRPTSFIYGEFPYGS